jgi:hypothetical protein
MTRLLKLLGDDFADRNINKLLNGLRNYYDAWDIPYTPITITENVGNWVVRNQISYFEYWEMLGCTLTSHPCLCGPIMWEIEDRV